ncbi:MAG: crotonase/enoyl-CoA hydratase family protein [Alphaproteobacteria bacterium]|nr:crotonase/enoyl-CoA hydratase family protein [Alphaproteobacteria bacterium]MBN9577954.1 crotonase/enoyl-CoA hydratase family protein [Alphaproteobacteria bacterium]OJU55925.1 MAG: enoyl-CoA hydratase [Alphaproteobacteria bacterium 62-8]
MENVLTERNGPVTTVILNRPERRNAVDRTTADALAAAFLAFETDENASVAVLCGAGGHFCAGADLKGVAEGKGNRTHAPNAPFDPLAADAPMGPTRMRLSKPVIAAVSGYAVAGGLELALWCDLRVAEENATFGVFCRRWGVPLIDGGTVRLPRLIGQSRALDMILTGRPVGAMEAFAMGLANRVVPKGTARTEAETLAREIARLPQTCLRSDRSSVYEQWGLDGASAVANEFAHGLNTIRSGETAKGAARFADGHGRGGRFDDI